MATATTNSMTAPAAMLASAMTAPSVGEAFNAAYGDGTWTMEEKLDGHRVAVVKRGTTVAAWSRLGKGKTLPAHILAAVGQMPDGIYDGELVVPGGQSWNVTETTQQKKLALVLFDVLEVLGESLLTVPQAQRRGLLALATAHATGAAVALAPEYAPDWATIEQIWARGGEGVILKRKTALYRPGYRSPDWQKVKKLIHLVGTVTGFEAGSFGPYAVTRIRLQNGSDCKVKTKNAATIREIAANPESFIGRRLVIEAQQLTPSGSPRHPMFDHWAGEAE